MRFYGNLTKVDTEQRMVWGYASTEDIDAHGEIILKSAIEDALDDYMEWANIREMHQLSAVGTAKEASVDDTGLYLGAKVVDDTAWGKVTSGVYKGFSIGGKVLARDPKNKKIITKILLSEISLVDRPSNPKSRFDIWKAAGSPQEDACMAAARKKSSKIALVRIPADAKSDVITKTVNDAVVAGAAIAVASEAQGELLKAINDKVAFVVQSAELPLESDAVAKAAETAVDATSADPVIGEGDLEKTDEAQDVAGQTAVEGEATIAKAEGEGVVAATAGESSEPAVDAITKATAALDKIDAAVASVAKTDDVKMSMYHVGRFAELLESLSYLASSAQSEADFEGDASPVPAALRDWLKAGSVIFKDMAKEEVDEFVAGFKAKKSVSAGEITLDITAVGGEALAKSITDLTGERDGLIKSLAERDEALAKALAVVERVEPLAKTVEDLVATNTALAKRLEIVEAHPAEAKTAGPMAVSKEADAGGAGALAKAALPGEEDIAKALAEMPEEDRALLLIKASRQLPRAVTYR